MGGLSDYTFFRLRFYLLLSLSISFYLFGA
jgi:hypothetical protein